MAEDKPRRVRVGLKNFQSNPVTDKHIAFVREKTGEEMSESIRRLFREEAERRGFVEVEEPKIKNANPSHKRA